MKRHYTFLMAAFALLALFAIPIGMRGQTTETVTLSGGTFSTDHITWTCADGNITIQQLKGSSNTAVNSSYVSAPRVYKQNILSFVGVNGYTITNIDIKCNGAYYGTTMYAGTEISNNNVENNTDELDPTWTTSNNGTHSIATISEDGLTEIYIQNGHSSDASNQLRITQLSITYIEGSGSITATTVTINSEGITNTDVYQSTAAGSLSASVTETESGDVISGATVTWSSSNPDVATINENGVVTLVDAGTTTITASYAGVSGTYSTSSATYTLNVTNSAPYEQPTTIEIIPNYTFWGKTGQFSGSTYSELSGSQDNLSLEWTRGSGSTYANSTAMRFYKDNTLTFTAPTGYVITSIVITFSTTQSDLSFSPEGYTLSGTTGTWEGSASTVTMTRPSNGASYAQITQFTITLSMPSSVATPTFSPASGTEFGDEGLSVTISCDTDGVDIYYTIDGSTPSDDGCITYNGPFTVTETTTIKAIAYDGDDASPIATATYIYVDPNAPGTANNPYTVALARAAIDAGTGTQGVYATGIVCTASSQLYNNKYLSYYISADGLTTSDQLEAYNGLSFEGASFTSANDVQVGDSVVIYGNLTKYNSTYEFAANNQLYYLHRPAAAVEAPTFSPVAGTYADAQTVTISCATDGVDIYYTLDGNEPDDKSNPYSSAITVSQTTTIKAIAYDGDLASAVATATYHINSQENPYTVTQALAFNEYPANGIYVHGIVSTAPTQDPTNNGELTYYISDNGETTNQLEVYKGKDLEQAAFTAQDDIQVGDIVTIYGNVQVYNDIIEFGSGNYLVSFERPASTEPSITVDPATINALAEGTDGSLTITYENIPDLISFDIQFCDAQGEELEGDAPDWIYVAITEPTGEEDYSVDYIIDSNDGDARNAYFKVYTFVGDELEELYSNLITISQAAYVAPVEDYATLPFEFNGGRADIENTSGLTHDGLDSDYNTAPKLKFNTTGDWLLLQFNERPGTLSFDIKGNTFSGGTFTVQTSEDGTTYTDLETYTALDAVQHEEFTNLGENVRYIKWIYTEKSSGNVALGNITLTEYTEPVLVASITVDPEEVNEDAEEHDGTLTLSYENLTISDMTDFGVQYYDAEGEETADPDWIEVLVAEQDPQIGEGYVVSYYMFENEDEARTVYFKVFAMGDDDFVYSNLVTINQAAPEVPPTPGNWVLTDLADLTENDIFVIVGTDDEQTYALPNDGGTSAPSAVSITVVDGTLSGEPDANLQWNVSGNATDGYTFFVNGDHDNWLYCSTTASSGNNNNIKVGTGDRKLFVLDEDGYLITNDDYATRYLSIYFNAGNAQDWRGYLNTNNGALPISFYKKVETPELESHTLNISGYANSSNPDGGYYLIASPVTVNPDDVEGMTEGNYDLYWFDQTQAAEWQNYKKEHFDLVPGKGYLYAHETGGEFTLTGVPYDGDGTIKLVKDDHADFVGWNLVGNPFGQTTYIDRPFYTMKADGSEIILGEGNEIAAMQGIFVIAENDDDEMTFSTVAPNSKGRKIVLNVSSSNRNDVIDRAMIHFDGNRTLPKFMLNDENTKMYIPQNGNDFAVVNGRQFDKIPVNFQVAEDGIYTISVDVKNVSVKYLHLIDNLTGENINLLQTPSYTFKAMVHEKPFRFELEYRTGVSIFKEKVLRDAHNDDFSVCIDGNWIINNEGEAVLQVVDVNGRVLSSENIRGCYSKHLETAPGVYMLRLINGENVKTQKIVVK